MLCDGPLFLATTAPGASPCLDQQQEGRRSSTAYEFAAFASIASAPTASTARTRVLAEVALHEDAMLRRKAPRIASAEGTPDCAIEFLLSTRIEQAFDATKDGRKQIHSSVCHGRDSGGIWRTTRTFSGYSSFGGSSVWSTVEQICRGCPNTSTPTCTGTSSPLITLNEHRTASTAVRK